MVLLIKERWVKGIIFHYSFEFCVLCFQWMSCLLNLDIDYNTFSHIRIICDLICKMQNSVMCGGGLLSKHLDTNHDWQVNNIPCMTGKWIFFFVENTYYEVWYCVLISLFLSSCFQDNCWVPECWGKCKLDLTCIY